MQRWTRRAALSTAALGIGAAPHLARAQSGAAFADRPLRIIVPFAPGGSTDIITRLLSEPLRQHLGQPVVVENRPGANGQIVLEQTARAKPDGTTAMIGNVTTNGTAPLINARRLGFDYERDMQIVTRIADVPSVLVATKADLSAATLPDLVAYARASPGKLNYMSTGVGSYTHLDTVLLARAADIRIEHVVLSAGAGPTTQSLIAGHVHFGFLNVATATPLIQGGQLSALAVTGEQRLPALPTVPTMAEAGFPGIGTSSWHVMMVPAGVPAPVMETLFQATRAAILSDAVQAAFRRQSIQSMPSASPDEAKTWLQAELARWRTILRETRIEATE